MYEYKCMNDTCDKTWTIDEGEISTSYLRCPFCEKGRGIFLRQIKNEMHSDMRNIAIKKPNDNYADIEEIIIEKTEVENKENAKTIKKKSTKTESVNKEATKEKKKTKEKITKANEKEEDNIFDAIKKKHQQQDEFKKSCDSEDVDVLEIYASSEEEIENRIKEFEEYYYIKVLDKLVQQQGKKFTCMIKYCKK